MFSDGLLPLIDGGVVTNRLKKVHPGRSVTSFVTGSRRLFDFVDDNVRVEFHPCDRTNDPALIAKNDKVTAINSALEVDLSGQVCADSIGHRPSTRASAGRWTSCARRRARAGGKPIIALPSTRQGRELCRRIVATLTDGAGVVTTRGHVQWVVTEYGAVNLHGMPRCVSAPSCLIGIAHPDFRAELRREFAELRHVVLG
jgi:4-hydroxybutyrate CoA-transferase